MGVPTRSGGQSGHHRRSTRTHQHIRNRLPELSHAGHLETPGGLPIHEDIKYGVGTIVAARFDEPIANKAEAERRLTVTANPPIRGSWYWVDDQTAHWRPEILYAPGTTVTVTWATSLGAKLGDGLYRQGTPGARFTIGDAHVPWPTTPPNR